MARRARHAGARRARRRDGRPAHRVAGRASGAPDVPDEGWRRAHGGKGAAPTKNGGPRRPSLFRAYHVLGPRTSHHRGPYSGTAHSSLHPRFGLSPFPPSSRTLSTRPHAPPASPPRPSPSPRPFLLYRAPSDLPARAHAPAIPSARAPTPSPPPAPALALCASRPRTPSRSPSPPHPSPPPLSRPPLPLAAGLWAGRPGEPPPKPARTGAHVRNVAAGTERAGTAHGSGVAQNPAEMRSGARGGREGERDPGARDPRGSGRRARTRAARRAERAAHERISMRLAGGPLQRACMRARDARNAQREPNAAPEASVLTRRALSREAAASGPPPRHRGAGRTSMRRHPMQQCRN